MRESRRLLLSAILGLSAGGVLLASLSDEAAAQRPGAAPLSNGAVIDSPIQPLPQTIKLDERKVALGNKLFHDKRLSRDNTVSCASCHNVKTNGADTTPLSKGIAGGRSAVNSPTVFNSGFNFTQFWDGRADSLESQVDGPVHHPKEMGSNWQQVLSKLQKDEGYVKAFNEIYKNGMRIANIKNAIADYERSLITPDAKFDRYLRGDTNALNAEEKAGYELFSDLGCVSCHQGRGVGGNMFQRFGIVGDYFRDRGNITQADYGRYNVTGDENDIHMFKVPSLRNVELTAPYLHDGQAKTLEDAVRIMVKYQLGRTLEEENVNKIVAFLKTLTGKTRRQN